MRQIDVTLYLAREVLKIAQQAGEVVMHHYVDLVTSGFSANARTLSLKSDKSPLTSADLQANAVIVSALSHLTPGIPIVSEESPIPMDHPQQDGDFWLVDPLDGTKEFLSKSDEFTVNIALVRNGKAILCRGGSCTWPCILGYFRDWCL